MEALQVIAIVASLISMGLAVFISWLHWRLTAQILITKEEIKSWINGTYAKRPTNADDIPITRREFHYANESGNRESEAIKELIRALQDNIGKDHALMRLVEKGVEVNAFQIKEHATQLKELDSQVDELKSSVYDRRQGDRNNPTH